MKTVLLTGEIHQDAAALLAQHAQVVVASDPTPQSLKNGVVDADVIVVRHPLPTDIFNHAPRLLCAVRNGAGVDMIPVDDASKRGILVANVPGINAAYVAEHAMGQIINLSRRLIHVQNAFRQCSWDRGKELALSGSRLKGKTVGIIGFGAIGKALAQMCRNGFEMNVVAVKRASHRDSDNAEVEMLEFDEVLRASDFLVVSCPLTPETEGLINATAFSKMKRSAYLINVARGAIVKSADLITALKNKDIAGAALDVYDETPLSRNSPFFDINELLLTPHVAAITAGSMKAMAWESAVQVVDVLQGKFPKNWVNVNAQEEIQSRWSLLGAFA